jgi:hypothetical protein
VKNRNNSHKTIKLQQKSVEQINDTNSNNNNEKGNNKSNVQQYVKKSGSVYCSSIFLSSDESYSFA